VLRSGKNVFVVQKMCVSPPWDYGSFQLIIKIVRLNG